MPPLAFHKRKQDKKVHFFTPSHSSTMLINWKFYTLRVIFRTYNENISFPPLIRYKINRKPHGGHDPLGLCKDSIFLSEKNCSLLQSPEPVHHSILLTENSMLPRNTQYAIWFIYLNYLLNNFDIPFYWIYTNFKLL